MPRGRCSLIFGHYNLAALRMKLNYDIELIGQKIRLVPYRKEFVEKYHEWMKDPYILEMTASEPLSIEEEYVMQESWRNDDKKLTFIVVADGEGADVNKVPSRLDFYQNNMAGDVNLFFNDRDDENVCEIEVMIAEEQFRRQGCAEEALRMIMRYALDNFAVRRFYCKINEVNAGSIALFTKKLGYKEVNYVSAFKEYEFELLMSAYDTNNCNDEPTEAVANIKQTQYIERPFVLSET